MMQVKIYRRFVVCWIACLAWATPLLAEEEADDGLVGVVVELLHDKDKDIRALALEQIRTEAKGNAATKLFAAELRKVSPEAQVGLLRALAGRGDGVARPAVLEVLGATQERTVKVAAIEAIGELGDPTDVLLLVEFLSAMSEDEVAAARASLTRLRGEKVVTLVATALKSPDAAVRVMLIEILKARRGLEAIPDVLTLATDADAKVRAAAMEALGELAAPEHIAGMAQGILAAEPGRERDAAEKFLASVCGRIEQADKQAAPLLAAMDKLNPEDQVMLLSALGRVGGPAALARIEQSIGSEVPALHEAGVRALCNWPDASVAARLTELAQLNKSDALRIAALRALIRIAPLADERTDSVRLALLTYAMSMATRDEERLLVLDRARTIRSLEALQFLVPYIDQPKYAEQACLSVVELAHHRTLRQPNKAEFDRVLDRVIATSQDAVVVDRANRYKKDQTWVRPAKAK